MIKLTWDEVNAWRLTQQHLSRPAKPRDLLSVVSRICGLHAQVMSAAELALWARMTDTAPAKLHAALWEDRTLVKSWAMRGTLHVLTAEDFPHYVAACGTRTMRRPPSYYKYHGVTPAQLEAIIAGVHSTLGSKPLTREQLADAIAEQAHSPQIAKVLRSGWGALLKPSAAQGDLCFGPNKGQQVTFVRPERWLKSWHTIEGQQGLEEVARRYLTTYGPAQADDFARWLGEEPAPAKRLFRALGDELEEVDVEGWRAWALAAQLPKPKKRAKQATVNLLPAFDPYTVAHCRHPAIVAQKHKARVSRPQGWISPVVLVDGRMEGIWEHETKRAATLVQVTMFDAPTPETRRQIEAEAARLGPFLGTEVEVAYA